jgi:hypothetical protein
MKDPQRRISVEYSVLRVRTRNSHQRGNGDHSTGKGP